METLTRLVSESLARHGFDRPVDYRRLQWSRWFRCESHHSLLSVPSKPGVFAVAEEIAPVATPALSIPTHGGTATSVQTRVGTDAPAIPTRVGTDASSVQRSEASNRVQPAKASTEDPRSINGESRRLIDVEEQKSISVNEGRSISVHEQRSISVEEQKSIRVDEQRSFNVEERRFSAASGAQDSAALAAVAESRKQARLLAVSQFFEADDMAFVLDRMLAYQNPLQAQLSSGRYFLRYVVIEDQSQRRNICAALNQWIVSSSEKATGIGLHFAASLEITPDGRTAAH